MIQKTWIAHRYEEAVLNNCFVSVRLLIFVIKTYPNFDYAFKLHNAIHNLVRTKLFQPNPIRYYAIIV